MKILSVVRPLLEAAVVVGVLITALRLLTGLFGRKSRVYRPTAGRQLRLLFWPLLCLGVGAPFLGSLVYAASLSVVELGLLLALAAVVVGFSFPAFLLHLRYYLCNQHTALVVEPRQNVLEVYEQGQRVPFSKADLVRVEYVTCQSDRLFWSSYSYLRLHLRTGPVITITSLLLPLQPLADFLRSTPLEHRTRWFCWL